MSHPHDRALIAFASVVLGILEDYHEWGSDTLAEIDAAALAFGLSTTPNENAYFREMPRADFKNPLEL